MISSSSSPLTHSLFSLLVNSIFNNNKDPHHRWNPLDTTVSLFEIPKTDLSTSQQDHNSVYNVHVTNGSKFPVNVFNLTVQPVSPYDITFFSIGLLICVVNIFFAFCVLLNHRFRAVRSKQPKMMATSVVFGTVAFISYAYTNTIITNHPHLCVLVNIWLLLLSLMGWICCIIVRLLTIFILFNVMVKYNIKRKIPTFLWFLFLMVPVVICCIVSTVLDHNTFVHPDASCTFSTGGFSIFVALVGFYVILLLLISILTINIRRAYKDTKIEVIMLVLVIFCTIIIAVCYSIRLNRLIPIRILISYIPLFLYSLYFYLVMYKVVWYTIRSWLGCNNFRRDCSYFEDWDMRFFLDSNNTIFSNEQVRRVMNLETSNVLSHQLIGRDDDLANSIASGAGMDEDNFSTHSSTLMKRFGSSYYIPESSANSADVALVNNNTPPQPRVRNQTAFRSIWKAMGQGVAKTYVDGDQVVTQQDILRQTVVNNMNINLDDEYYSPHKRSNTIQQSGQKE
ncbi:hypothetical protein C9374_012867 [Naegleria lovaniensis]|uniref:Uncharacterized protein n=1 Tax=Naegleria lovaniensis TaxID=51637 RepID=A0AA88GCU7_NAELO|nr:uncharacterized protein C9374_012867 [Naegleria lovaniensis]KAG2373135.1 hypothetical protein C9374_012867 [Naegleria lovaniensis]